MSAQQATRAIEIFENPYGITLPNGLVAEGTVNDTPVPYMIEILYATEIIVPGDMVINKTSNSYALVTNVGPGKEVYMSDDIFSSIGEVYQVWKIAQPESSCNLYIPEGGNTEVVTAGGDEVTFVFPVGSPIFLPVKVIRLLSAESTNIIAIW